MDRKYIMDRETASRKLRRLALQIMENNSDEESIVLAGIEENGRIVAECIRDIIKELTPSLTTELISLRLDKKNPGEVTLSPTPDLKDKVVVVIDDVSNSGRTLLYALQPLLSHHPRKIKTVVLVERSHNDFPVHPDYAGLTIATTLQEHIVVEVEGSTVTGAYLR